MTGLSQPRSIPFISRRVLPEGTRTAQGKMLSQKFLDFFSYAKVSTTSIVRHLLNLTDFLPLLIT